MKLPNTIHWEFKNQQINFGGHTFWPQHRLHTGLLLPELGFMDWVRFKCIWLAIEGERSHKQPETYGFWTFCLDQEMEFCLPACRFKRKNERSSELVSISKLTIYQSILIFIFKMHFWSLTSPKKSHILTICWTKPYTQMKVENKDL